MPARALADMLQDFGDRHPVPSLPAIDESPSPKIDIDGLIAAESARVETAVTERLTAIYEATLQAERETHQAELNRMREDLGGNAGERIAAHLVELEERLASLTADAVSRILATITTEDLREKAVASLARTIVEAMHDTDALRVRVTGPLSLFEPFRRAVGARADSFEYRESGSFDLLIDIDGDLFETRLNEWAAVVAEVIA